MWGYEGLNQYNYAIQQLSDGGYVTVGSTQTDAEELKIFLTRLSPDAVGVNENPGHFVENGIEFLDVYPNPVASVATIIADLKIAGNIEVTVFNILGDEVYKTQQIIRETGKHEITIDTFDFPPGLYFCQISSGIYSKVIKLKKVF